MAAIKSFGDAARVAAEREADHFEPITVKILDREITVDYPGSGQIVYMTAELAEVQDDLNQVGGLMNFIYRLVPREDAQYIRQQLLDPLSGFDGEEVVSFVEYLVEEWSSRPTEKSSVSSPSRPKTGQSSTAPARRRASTR